MDISGQPSLTNGQGHIKGSYGHDERIMKNGSSGSNSSKFIDFLLLVILLNLWRVVCWFITVMKYFTPPCVLVPLLRLNIKLSFSEANHLRWCDESLGAWIMSKYYESEMFENFMWIQVTHMRVWDRINMSTLGRIKKVLFLLKKSFNGKINGFKNFKKLNWI